MGRRRAIMLWVCAAALLLIQGSRPSVGHGLAPSAQQQPQAEIGEFVAFCPFNHRASDDPIVYPSQPGVSHSHDFFGNLSTDAHSTLESLLTSGTNCEPLSDRSPYWVPTLYTAQRQAVAVEHATFYYTVHIAKPTELQSFPLGLRIIAGSARANQPPTPSRIKWSCLGAGASSTSNPVACPADSKLELLINFPDCWNGQTLDSPDHQSHMAYSVGEACPVSHAVPVPALQFKLRYASSGASTMILSSGPGYTAHADFLNVWEPAALESRVNCLRQLIKCGPEVLSSLYLPYIQR